MTKIINSFQLDVTQRGLQHTVIGVHCGDSNTRVLEIELIANGKRWVPPDNYIATLWAVLPNGKTVYKICENLPGGVISVTLSGTTNGEEVDNVGETSFPGLVKCELRVTAGNVLLTSPLFAISVEGVIHDDNSAEAQSSFSALTDALGRVLEAESGLDSKVDAEWVKAYVDEAIVEGEW